MCATVDSQCLEYLGYTITLTLMPASLHQSVTKNQTTEIFLFLLLQFKKKRTEKVASFSNWDKKSNNFGDLGLGFWSQIEVMKRALHTGCLILKRMILNGSEW